MKNILLLHTSKECSEITTQELKSVYNLYLCTDEKALISLSAQYHPSLVIIETKKSDRGSFPDMVLNNNLFKKIPILCIVEPGTSNLYKSVAGSLNIDFIAKPLQRFELSNRVKNYINIYDLNTQGVNEITGNIGFETTQAILLDFIDAASDYRNTEPQGHVKRMQNYAKALALELQKKEPYHSIITDKDIMSLYLSAPLHDIGKAAVPDEILYKKGSLDPEEYETVKTHTTAGYEALKGVEKKLHNTEFLQFASDIVFSHHERWDGAGYPRQLKGNEITIFSRIMGLVDVYDALISITLYRPAFSHMQAVEIIREERGKHFCPDVAGTFLKIHEDFRTIAIMNADSMVEIETLNS